MFHNYLVMNYTRILSHLPRYLVTFTKIRCHIYQDTLSHLPRYVVTFTKILCHIYQDIVIYVISLVEDNYVLYT